MLNPLDQLLVRFDRGADISPTDAAEKIGMAGLLRGEYICTVEPAEPQKQRWIPLAENRWGKGVRPVLGEGIEGVLVVLPQL